MLYNRLYFDINTKLFENTFAFLVSLIVFRWDLYEQNVCELVEG